MPTEVKTLARRGLVAAAVQGAGFALAQDGASPAPAASTPGMGPGSGMGRRAGDGVTPGWSLMSPEERTAHHAAMAGMTSTGECTAYRDRQHQQRVERAKQRGQTVPGAPQQDVCAGMKK